MAGCEFSLQNGGLEDLPTALSYPMLPLPPSDAHKGKYIPIPITQSLGLLLLWGAEYLVRVCGTVLLLSLFMIIIVIIF